jgi:hypothetical protein
LPGPNRERALQNGDRRATAICFEALAAAACACELYERAARLYGAAARLRETIGTPLPLAERADYDRQTTATSAALGPDSFNERRSEGASWSLERAVAYALSWK